MPDYVVKLLETEVWRYVWLVEADNPTDAIEKAIDGDGHTTNRNFVSGVNREVESVEQQY